MFGHLQLFLKTFIKLPPTCYTMSTSQSDKDDAPVTQHVNFTYQLDEDDEPVTTHVDMGEIMSPRSGSEANGTAHQDTAADTKPLTNGSTDGGKSDDAKPGDSQQSDAQPDDAQTDNNRQGSI